MILADSNLLIYAIQPEYGALRVWLAASLPKVSAVSVVEVLGYHRLNAAERAALETVFAALDVLYPGPETVLLAVGLRQQRRMSLGDALIAATALEYGLRLATHNLRDFDGIAGLDAYSPLAG